MPNHNMLEVFTIIETDGGKARWTKVGVAFINRDQSINVKLDALPVNGTLHVRERKKIQRQDDADGTY